MREVEVFAPATLGNVGPGFDVLGLAIAGLGDRVRLRRIEGPSRVDSVEGLDADSVPRDPSRNATTIAAEAYLRAKGLAGGVAVSVLRGLPISGGLGGSAAASLAGALGVAHCVEAHPAAPEVLEAALAGESSVAGRHLDNIAPCYFGGLTITRSVAPIDVVRVEPPPWWVAVVTPDAYITTREARAVLPHESPRADWIAAVANTAALVTAFTRADPELASRALVDGYAEPRRAGLILGFHETKRAALAAGALGATISGAGPTIFALAVDEATARAAMTAMARALPRPPRYHGVHSLSPVGATVKELP